MKRLMMTSLIGTSLLLSSCVHGGKSTNLNGYNIQEYEGSNYCVVDFNNDGIKDALIKINDDKSDIIAVSKEFIYENDIPYEFNINNNTLKLTQETFNYVPKLIKLFPTARPNLDELFLEISSR